MKFNPGDILIWTCAFDPEQKGTCKFLRYENRGTRVVCNNWYDSPDDPEREDICVTENFRHLTPLEKALL
jgi:hypothetical protein